MTRPARGGAFCSPEGTTGQSSTGRDLVCSLSSGDRARWRAADGSTQATNSGSAPGTRRALLAELRKQGIPLSKRGLPEDDLRALLAAGTPAAAVADSAPAAGGEAAGDRIRAAYRLLSGGQGAVWVSIADVREALPDLSRGEVDKALLDLLAGEDRAYLDPEAFMHRVGDRERAAAISVGGEDRHNIRFGS